MESQNPLGEEHEFDRLLRQARWPEPRSEQIARLGDHLRAVARRRRTRLRYGALAVAASVALFATVLALRQGAAPPQADTAARSEPARVGAASGRAEVASVEQPPVEQPQVEHSPVEQSRHPADPQSPDAVATAAPPQPMAASPLAGSIEPRDPTPYERIVFMAATASRRPHRAETTPSARAEQKAVKAKPGPRLLDELIALLAADPAAAVDEQLAAAQSDVGRYEPALRAIVDRGDPKHRLAATLVIARIGTAQSLPVLAGLLGDPATHKAAIAGLCRLASPADLRWLVAAEPSSALRQNLLTALLARRTEESVRLYLEFVGDVGYRADALAASSAMADPPIDLLIAFLESPQSTLRLAAAQAVGSLPEVDIASRLIDSVYGGIGRQEALLALLLSPDAQSARFLSGARRDISLVASVYAAEQQLRSLTLTER